MNKYIQYIYIYPYIYIYMYKKYTYVCFHIYLCIFLFYLSLSLCHYIYLYIYMCIYIHVYISIYKFVMTQNNGCFSCYQTKFKSPYTCRFMFPEHGNPFIYALDYSCGMHVCALIIYSRFIVFIWWEQSTLTARTLDTWVSRRIL